MTREEAQALAEREVMACVREDGVRRLARQYGMSEREFAASTLRMATLDIHRRLTGGTPTTEDVASLAALCIEHLREEHLAEQRHVD